jgi:hypothetical protein
MIRQRLIVFAVVLLLASAAVAQMAPSSEPPVFTYVAEWNVPRAQWADYKTFAQSAQPILDKLMANGTILGYGAYETFVHELDGPTHGTWWTANSIANLDKARVELLKLAPSQAQLQAKHRDYLLRSVIHKGSSVKPGSGFLVVAYYSALPGKGQEWRALWEKYQKPVFDELVANGTITQYGLDVEQVHTSDPNGRYLWYTTSGADGVDKVGAAQNAANEKRTEQERQTITLQLAAVSDGKMHRDFYGVVTTYAHK